MQSTIGRINLDNLFQTLWQAQQEYLADALKRSNVFGDFVSSNPAIEVGQFLRNFYSFNVGKGAEIEGRYLEKQLALWSGMWMQNAAGPVVDADKGDRRFDAQEWQDYRLSGWL